MAVMVSLVTDNLFLIYRDPDYQKSPILWQAKPQSEQVVCQSNRSQCTYLTGDVIHDYCCSRPSVIHWSQTSVLKGLKRIFAVVYNSYVKAIKQPWVCHNLPKYNTFTLMMTGAVSQNIGKLFSELKLVTDNLLFTNIVSTNFSTLVFLQSFLV